MVTTKNAPTELVMMPIGRLLRQQQRSGQKIAGQQQHRAGSVWKPFDTLFSYAEIAVLNFWRQRLGRAFEDGHALFQNEAAVGHR